MGSNGRVGMHNEYLVKGPSIIVGRKGSAGSITWEPLNCFPIDTTYYVQLKNNDCLLRYIYYIMKRIDFDTLINKMNVPGLNRENVYSLKIPVPPLDVQQKIIDECEAIEAQIAEAEKKLETLKDKTAEILNKYLS